MNFSCHDRFELTSGRSGAGMAGAQSIHASRLPFLGSILPYKSQ